MQNDMTRRKQQLHDFLQAARARIPPADLRINVSASRRGSGLHQADVAAALNVSQRWYNGLENGSTVPGGDLLDQLADVLRLTQAERVNLYLLTTGHEPAPGTVEPPYRSEGPLTRLVHCLDDSGVPAVVTDIAWNVYAWNHAVSEWIPDPATTAPGARNTILWTFSSAVERVVTDLASLREAVIGQVHLAFARHPGDPRLEHLVARLQLIPTARDLWDRQHIGDFTSSTTPLRLRPPGEGALVRADLISADFPGEHRLLMVVPRDGWPAHPPGRRRLIRRRNHNGPPTPPNPP
jgi:transcriptional regulator with XRE-family HTH domain